MYASCTSTTVAALITRPGNSSPHAASSSSSSSLDARTVICSTSFPFIYVTQLDEANEDYLEKRRWKKNETREENQQEKERKKRGMITANWPFMLCLSQLEDLENRPIYLVFVYVHPALLARE